MTELFVRTIKSLSGKFGFDPLTNLPTFSIELGDLEQPQYTLAEIFNYLDSADKPCLIAVDEFQQIAKYSEKNIEALLRSHIQSQGNSRFIFAGSERHIIQEMFLSSARPFYLSADMLELGAIDRKVYIEFVIKNFENRGRKIAAEDVGRTYDMFKGLTFYIQKAFNGAFSLTPEGDVCSSEIVDNAIDEMVHANETLFREILSSIPEKQKMVLYAIAKEGESSQITSSQFIKRHSLPSASSVQSAVRILLDKEILTVSNKTYSLSDKLFSMWINTIHG